MKVVLGEQLFTIDEVAKMLGVSRATVSSYIKKGMLTARPLGVRKYITEDAIRAFLFLPSKVEVSVPSDKRDIGDGEAFGEK